MNRRDALFLIACAGGSYLWFSSQRRRSVAVPRQPFAAPGFAPDAVPPDPASFPTGYTPNPGGTEQYLRELRQRGKQPYFQQAAPEIMRADPKLDRVLLYKALYKACREATGAPFLVTKQAIGDCVSFGTKHGIEVLSAVDKQLGKNGMWKLVASEPIYGGSRVQAQGRNVNPGGDGSYGAAAAKWIRDWGVLYREVYGAIDLRQYTGQRAKQYGYAGCPRELEGTARKHPVKTVAVTRTFEEAARAIQNGYPVNVCSGQGFSNRRDAQGFSAAQGSWSHSMCFIGYRGGDRPGLLCLNSWGPSWIAGPKWPEDQPEGSFWVDARVASRMLSGGDSFAYSGYEGFPARQLRHGDFF